MQKYTKRKRRSTRFQLRPIWLLSLIALLFVVCGLYLTFAPHSHASTNTAPISTQAQDASVIGGGQKTLDVTPAATQKNLNKMQQPTATLVHTPVVTTSPTSTPQYTQEFSVFCAKT